MNCENSLDFARAVFTSILGLLSSLVQPMNVKSKTANSLSILSRLVWSQCCLLCAEACPPSNHPVTKGCSICHLIQSSDWMPALSEYLMGMRQWNNNLLADDSHILTFTSLPRMPDAPRFTGRLSVLKRPTGSGCSFTAELVLATAMTQNSLPWKAPPPCCRSRFHKRYSAPKRYHVLIGSRTCLGIHVTIVVIITFHNNIA